MQTSFSNWSAGRQGDVLRAPAQRGLQVFAFDPSLDLDLSTARVNRSVIQIPWEPLQDGPVGEYIEVIDIDPSSKCGYEPLNLNHEYLLAERGHRPSEGNPQFHQQMVYAVAMMTIENFQRALGRRIHWSPRLKDEHGRWLPPRESYVPRLRIYPHALREANAYYSPEKKALLFGYFNAQNIDARDGLPGSVVFSCLSHDIIAHEMTHAILDGIHRRLLEPTNPDVLAFHEGFADLVAILQHFTLPGVLANQIARTRGNLGTENLLAKLAVEFGHATQRGNALRDALGEEDEQSGEWRRRSADPEQIGRVMEPHARGALLVAAVFDAFLTTYEAQTADLLRIATEGSGVLRAGELHPDLVTRLAAEAGRIASRILTMCIRALDYLPPVDVTFGDFLRALITIDGDLEPDDISYRIAIINGFRNRGIYPRDVRTLSQESLRWRAPSEEDQLVLQQCLPPVDMLRLMAFAQDYPGGDGLIWREPSDAPEADDESSRTERLKQALQSPSPVSRRDKSQLPDSGPQTEESLRRHDEYMLERDFAQYLHGRLKSWAKKLDPPALKRLDGVLGVELASAEWRFEVHAVRPTTRIRRDGRTATEVLVMLTQRRIAELPAVGGRAPLRYKFRAGCTLLIDPVDGSVRYAISKRLGSQTREARQAQYLLERIEVEGRSAHARYGVTDSGNPQIEPSLEPFRLLHGGTWEAYD